MEVPENPENPDPEVVIPEEGTDQAPAPETPEKKSSLSDEEIAAIIDGLTEEGLAALESQYSAEDFAAIKKAFEEKNKKAEEEEEKEPEQKLVTVTYEASLGGKVSNSNETIDLNDEDAKFVGSTASAVNKYYQFVAWVDGAGNTVCSEATFVPSDIDKDATFTANFMKLSEMPAQSFSGSAGGMNVSVSADEGIFPEGTSMNVSAISDDEALDAAKDAIGESVQQAKGVDITFRNADGEEIEPADSRYVHVSISLASELEGDSFSVVHKDNSGKADVIADASASGAEFEANQFSVYIVAGSGDSSGDTDDQKATETYIFKVDTEVFNTQVIKKNEELIDPGIPELGDNQEFKGWFYKEGNLPVEFGPRAIVTAEKTIECYAKIDTTFYLTFIGVDGEVVEVKQKVVEGTAPAMITTSDVRVEPAKADQAHRGWSYSPDSTKCETEVNAREHDKVYAVVMDAYWITFYENDGDDHGGASYTGPVSVFADQVPADVRPANPTRKGYTFGQWYRQPGSGDGQVVGDEFNWNEEITENISLYAKWTPNATTEYTINIWQQKISDSKTITDDRSKSYDFKRSITKTGTTGAPLNEADIADYKNVGDEGFHYKWFEIVRNKDGVNVPTDEIRAKGDTVINVYYDRDLMKIIFNTYNKDSKKWEEYKTMEGLYGQSITFYPEYSWPTEYDWYASHTEGRDQTGTGTRLTFLDAFLFKGLTGVSPDGKTLTQYAATHLGTNRVNFYLQNIDETWPDTYEDQMLINSSAFTVTDKYNGFTAAYYKKGNESEWKSLGARQSNGTYGSRDLGGGELDLRFSRNKYSITLKSVFQGNIVDAGVIKDIPYQADLDDYKDAAEALADKPGYKFIGWCEDTKGGTLFTWTGTMPAANKVIYGCYAVKTYHVSLDTDGGDLIDTQIAEFDVEYGAIIDRVSLEKTTKPGYQLVGWYEGNKPYDYREVDDNVTLKAKWRNPGTVKVVYDATELGFDPPVDAYSYAASSTVVVGAPAKPISGYTFVGWTLVGDTTNTIYYPNGCFEITPELVKNGVVTLKAQYVKTGGEGGLTTFIKYHANDGSGRTKEVAVNADGDDLLVNEKIIALTVDEAGFTRSDEYEFKGWSKTPGEDNTVDIPAGSPIAADNNGIPEANNLYAVWELVYTTYVIEYYKGNQRIFTTEPIRARVHDQISLSSDQLNAKKPSVGYLDGRQEKVPYEIKKNQDNIVKVIYDPIQITVTVEGKEETVVYDGKSHTVTGFKVTNITPDVGYKAEYVGYAGNLDYTATHVSESGKTDLDVALFQNTSNLFDDNAITFVIGGVKANKLTITPATLTVNTPTETKIYDGTPLTAEGTISGFVNGETATFATTGTVTYPSEGQKPNSYSLTFDKSALAGDYTVSETVGTLQVFENKAEITVKTVGGTYVYDGKEHSAEVTYEGVPTGYTVETAASSAKAKDVTESPVFATADQLVIRNANGDDVTGNLNIKYVNGSISITPAPVTIETPTASKVYDGTPLTAEGTISGLVNGETVTFETTGSQTEAGTSDNTYRLVWDKSAKASNYEIKSVVVGKLTVTDSQNKIVVTTTGGSFTYDGKPHGATVNVSTLPAGYRVQTAASDAVATDVTDGKITAKADHLVIVNAQGTDVTSKLNITFENGYLEITPATLIITTDSAEKTYDGDPLTADGDYDGLVNGETISFAVTGTITNVGKVDNTYELVWDGTAKESNYTLEEHIGTLEVKEFAGKILVKTVGENVEYDGKEHGAEVTVEGLPKGYTFTAASNATATDVTEADVPANCDELVILNALGEDVTDELDIEYTPGFIRIIPAKVTVTIVGNNKTTKYNGYEQTVEGYKVTDISNELYKESDMSFTGEPVAKGKIPGTYNMGLDKDEKFKNTNKNFEVTFAITDGFLTIEKLDPGQKFKIIAITHDTERDYTGEYYNGFGYDLIGEGPTQGMLADAFGKVADAFRSVVRGLKADADDGEGKSEVTINGVTYIVTGLSVPTNARNAGTYPLTIIGEMKVSDGEHDVTDQFELVEKREGTLTINKMVINLTSGSASKVYDGNPLTNTTVTADKNWGVGDTVRYDFTGSQTAVGESDNLFVAVGIDGTDPTLKENYDVHYTYGKLTVTSAPTPPTPGGGGDPTPGGGTTITDDPTPTAPTPVPVPAPAAAVLGETRTTDGAAVLGARRGRTEDDTNQTGRIVAVLIAAAIVTALMFTKKKDDEEENRS